MSCLARGAIAFVHGLGGRAVDTDGNSAGSVSIVAPKLAQDFGNARSAHDGSRVAVVLGFGGRQGNRIWDP